MLREARKLAHVHPKRALQAAHRSPLLLSAPSTLLKRFLLSGSAWAFRYRSLFFIFGTLLHRLRGILIEMLVQHDVGK